MAESTRHTSNERASAAHQSRLATMTSDARDCVDGAYIWVQASQRAPTTLQWSFNGKYAPAFRRDIIDITVPVVRLDGLVPTSCAGVEVMASAALADGSGQNLTAVWSDDARAYVVRELMPGPLMHVTVTAAGRFVTDLDYAPLDASERARVGGSLGAVLGVAALWVLAFLMRDVLARARRARSAAAVALAGAPPRAVKSVGSGSAHKKTARRGDDARTSFESSDAAAESSADSDGTPDMTVTNQLRQRGAVRTEKLQRQAIAEIKAAAMVKFAKFLPEDPMAVAVWLETSVCHLEDFAECYGISLFDIARVVHTYLVRELQPSGAKSMTWEQPEWSAFQLVRDGYFFVVVVMAELLLEGFTGSGVFTSAQMTQPDKNAVTLALGVGLVTALPFMMSMSRNASPFLYQLVLASVPTVLCRDLAGGALCIFFGALLTTGVAGAILQDLLRCVLLGALASGFGAFMLLATMLYLFRLPDPHVLLPTGRRASFLLLVLVALLFPYALQRLVRVNDSAFWIGMHASALWLATLLMALRIRGVSVSWHAWLPALLRRAEEMKGTAAALPPKLARLSLAQRAEALWLVNRKNPDEEQWMVLAETESAGFWEYFAMAIEDLKKQNLGTPERRSAELFDANIHEIMHGVLYFAILGFSAAPLFFTRGTASTVSRGILYAMIAFLFAAGTIELFVEQISAAKQRETHDLLIPASKSMVKAAEARMHAARLDAYGGVMCSFQLTALRWFLLATVCAYLLEPAALFVTLPFGAGYNLVLYAMVSRMFLSGFADRAHVAVTVGVGVGVLVLGLFALVSELTAQIGVAVVLACLLIRGLRWLALAYATFDSSTPQLLSNLLLETSRSTLLHTLLTAGVSVMAFWGGELATLSVNQAFFAPTGSPLGSLGALAAAVGATVAMNLVVFGFFPVMRLCCARTLKEWEPMVEYRMTAFIAFTAGFVHLYLPPLSLGALLGFMSAAWIYAHTMRHLVLQPRNTWAQSLDPADIPMTSGKRILDGGGLTQVKPEVREQQLADRLKKGLINAAPLLFDQSSGLGDQVLDFIDRRRLLFRKSALRSVVPDQPRFAKKGADARGADGESVASPTPEEADGDVFSEDDESWDDLESARGRTRDARSVFTRTTKRTQRTALAGGGRSGDGGSNTFLQSVVLSRMETLIDDCRAGNVFVYLCDAAQLYKEGFMAIGIRRKQVNSKLAPADLDAAEQDADAGSRGARAAANRNMQWRASPLWREQAANRLNIYVGVDAAVLRSRDGQLPEEDPGTDDILGRIAECMIHEYVEDATRSHALASVAELAMLDARRDGYLPRSLRWQLERMGGARPERLQHLLDMTEAEVARRNANAKRLPTGWRFDKASWVEACNIEKEMALEIGDLCETLLRRNVDWCSFFATVVRGQFGFFTRWVYALTKDSLRLWYVGLRGDMEVHREVCAYLKHVGIAPSAFSSFRLLLFVHKWMARPLFEVSVHFFAWSCSPLYVQLFGSEKRKRAMCLAPPHASLQLGEERIRKAFQLLLPAARPALFATHALRDVGQTFVPGILTAALDEQMVMNMAALEPYWLERQRMCRGQQPFLKFSRDTARLVEQRMRPQSDAMHTSMLSLKPQDLLVMGRAGSAHATVYKARPDKVNVVVDASATLFYVTGGVTTCLMQLVSHKGVLEDFNLHVLAEVASNSTPRIAAPTECVSSIRPIPLHDVTSCPESDVLSARPYYDIALRKQRTTSWALRARFHPLLRELIRGCCELQGVEDRSSAVNDYFDQVFVGLYEFAQTYDWVTAWNDGLTWRVWTQTWLTLLGDKSLDVQKLWAPSIPGLQEALIFFTQTLRSLLCELPEGDLYHASHHGVGALKALVHKERYKSRVIVWDHGILLRERLSQLCEEDCLLHPFTRNAIIGLTRLTARLVYGAADVICPCTSANMYKEWICLIAGRPSHGPFAKRIRAIPNGTMPLYDQLDHSPVPGFFEDDALNQRSAADGPVVDPHHVHCVMLSHVLPIKDVVNAIRAAHRIVYERGMTVYRLHIFGGLDKDPKYVAECRAAIRDLALEDFVTLHGPGPKFKVLSKGDLFLNSSFSEGLPMAILEAMMAHMPVCCTDVGGSREVVPDARCRAPPRDPTGLGDAQILTLCGFQEEPADGDLNRLVLSSAARAKRKLIGDDGCSLAMRAHQETDTYDKHHDVMLEYATAAEDPSGVKMNPPPYSVPVAVSINVQVASAGPRKQPRAARRPQLPQQQSAQQLQRSASHGRGGAGGSLAPVPPSRTRKGSVGSVSTLGRLFGFGRTSLARSQVSGSTMAATDIAPPPFSVTRAQGSSSRALGSARAMRPPPLSAAASATSGARGGRAQKLRFEREADYASDSDDDSEDDGDRRADDKAQSEFGDARSVSRPLDDLVPRVMQHHGMTLDLEYIRNVRQGSHHPDASTLYGGADDDDVSDVGFDDSVSVARRMSARRVRRQPTALQSASRRPVSSILAVFNAPHDAASPRAVGSGRARLAGSSRSRARSHASAHSSVFDPEGQEAHAGHDVVPIMRDLDDHLDSADEAEARPSRRAARAQRALNAPPGAKQRRPSAMLGGLLRSAFGGGGGSSAVPAMNANRPPDANAQRRPSRASESGASSAQLAPARTRGLSQDSDDVERGIYGGAKKAAAPGRRGAKDTKGDNDSYATDDSE